MVVKNRRVQNGALNGVLNCVLIPDDYDQLILKKAFLLAYHGRDVYHALVWHAIFWHCLTPKQMRLLKFK
jgi:hypothetical protein